MRRISLLVSVLFLLSKCFWEAELVSAFQRPVAYSRSSRAPPLAAAAAASSSSSQDEVRTSQSFSSDASSGLSNFRYHAGRRKQQRDVIIVGGALAGLSAALYLAQMDPNRHITILDREEYGKSGESNSPNAQPASFAAAGMLAPQSERLPAGQLLDLCISSRRMFPDFCDMVETLAQESGDEGAPYLHENQFRQKDDTNSNNLDPWSVGYVGSGGFLAPAFAGDAVATWAPPEESGSAVWLDATQVHELEPSLHPEVVGGWWFPDDASVDARRLTCSLRAACVAAGVQLLSGPQYEVSSLDLVDGKCQGIWLQPSKNKTGQRYIRANTVLIANGAWMRHLLPVPIEPHKGQSLSLRMPTNRPPILRRVLFAQDSYIVPKADGRIVIGATVEAGSYDPNVTPAGLMHIMTHALQLVPGLKDLPVEETWVGLRPTTPDKGPILGKTPWDNLFIAGGYWRNGVLLAPKTGQLLASLIISSSRGDSQESLSVEDSTFLEAFAWDRFTNAAKSKALSANARYAASMHPVHSRSSAGVSAAVGTELGSYSSARAAAEERKQDRDALWKVDNSNDENEAFERAAAMGKEDAAAFTFGVNEAKRVSNDDSSLLHQPRQSNGKRDDASISKTPSYFEGSADAFTVGTASESDESTDLDKMYKAIQENKEKNSVELDDSNDDEEETDPGFRIYHVDPETGKERMVPPYTAPGDFLASIEREGATTSSQKPKQPARTNGASDSNSDGSDDDGGACDDYSEKTFDGYQDIQQSNARGTRQEELEAMREARRRNRLGQDEIDPSMIGAQRIDDDDDTTATTS